jgi:hypothetical protein
VAPGPGWGPDLRALDGHGRSEVGLVGLVGPIRPDHAIDLGLETRGASSIVVGDRPLACGHQVLVFPSDRGPARERVGPAIDEDRDVSTQGARATSLARRRLGTGAAAHVDHEVDGHATLQRAATRQGPTRERRRAIVEATLDLVPCLLERLGAADGDPGSVFDDEEVHATIVCFLAAAG